MNPIHGFELIHSQEIPEINTRAWLFRHIQTGAELLSMENDDENKVFCISFRTPPPDSTGLPHIMEHSVLGGSRKYPVKEPFVELMKGSLNTFLNAFTFPDQTSYPVASQNTQDLYNLIDVYLDAVFYPTITPDTLRQEGWHYELDSADKEMTYKGIVFNEMKGAYSSPDAVLNEKSQHLTFPDTPYSLDSGGDPTVIPNLTYAQFKAFHQTYYHPSNARIYFWGNDEPAERLRILNDYLQDYQHLAVDSTIPLQPRFTAPQRKVIAYDASEGDEQPKYFLTVNWLLSEGQNVDQSLALAVLEHVLSGTPAAPLRKTLIESGLGEDLAGRGLDQNLRQSFFSTGLKGILKDNVDQVERLILDTLAKLASEGIDPGTIAASLNTVEFSLRENNTGSFPRGLMVFLRSLSTWLYDGDPLAPLAFQAPLNTLKARLAKSEKVFETLIQQYLVENPHRVTLVLEPDMNLAEERAAAEKARLAQAHAAMSPAEVGAVVAVTANLKRRQEASDTPEALATIPMLSRADLDLRVRTIPTEVVTTADGTVLYHELFSNGIVYLDLGFDLHVLPQEYLPYVPLLGRALLEMGTVSQPFVELVQRIGRETGGISPRLFTSPVYQKQAGAAWLFLRGKAMADKAGELLAILKDILLTANMDDAAHFKQIVLEEKAALESGLSDMGHAIINYRLRARYNEADYAAEQMDGISQLFFLRRLAEQIDADWPGVLKTLADIRQLLVSRANSLANVTLDSVNWKAFSPRLESFLQALPSIAAQHVDWHVPPQPDAEGLTMPSQVNFVGKSADLYAAGYQRYGAAQVVFPYLASTWLWEQVRVKGGAYGGMGRFDQESGLYTFLSYRDPNLMDTLTVYDKTGNTLKKMQLSESELTKAIIGAIGDLDSYQLPDAKGYTAMARHLLGITDSERQHRRDEVLTCTVEDFHTLGEAMQRAVAVGKVAVLGSADSIEKANQQHAGLNVTRVL